MQRNLELGIVRSPSKADPEGGMVQSVSEKSIPGLLSIAAMMPSGEYIVGVQIKNEQLKAVIWEKNGLRHGEFMLPKEYKNVIDIGWTIANSILAIAFQSENGSIVSFYQRMNYKWYTKNTINIKGDICGFRWMAKKGHLLIVRKEGGVSIYGLESVISGSVMKTLPEENFAGVAVSDWNEIYISHFDKTVIPPPMSNYHISMTNQLPVIKISYTSSYLACLTYNSILLYSVKDYQKCNAILLEDETILDSLSRYNATQFQFLEYSNLLYAILAIPNTNPEHDQLFVLTISNGKMEQIGRASCRERVSPPV